MNSVIIVAGGEGKRFGDSIPKQFYQIFDNDIIDYTISKDSFVDISIYNILGQKIKTLYSGFNYKGENNIKWDGTNQESIKVSSGNYIVNILNENNNLTQMITLMK